MSAKKATTSKKKQSARHFLLTHFYSAYNRHSIWWNGVVYGVRSKILQFKSRRPHRSFRLSRRRDYSRSLLLPGLFAFTHSVNLHIWQQRGLFVKLLITYALLAAAVGSVVSQDTYLDTYEALEEIVEEIAGGDFGALPSAGVVLLASITDSIPLDDVQQILIGMIILLVWLTTLWLLREIKTGRRPRLRDGLYNAGAPIVSTFLVVIVMLLQLIPAGLAALVYSSLSGVGLIDGGFSSMLGGTLLAAAFTLTLYWMIATFFALIVVTLPGMYPMRALSIAGDLVVGRRLRLMIRIVWMALVVVIWWLVLMVPIILLESWLRSTWDWVEYAPIVPVAISLMGAATTIWSAAYIYLLYRKVIDDDASPA